MAANNENQLELRLFGHLLTPSYLSATLAIGSTLLLIGSALVSRLYWSDGWIASSLQTISESNNYIFAGRTGSGDSTINAVLLFLFWACVGLAVYFLAMGVVRAASELGQLEREVNYVHSDRRAVMRTFVGRMLIRLLSLAMLFAVASLYVKIALPYALSVARSAKPTIASGLEVVLGGIFLILILHVVAVVLRAIALRPRLFSDDIG